MSKTGNWRGQPIPLDWRDTLKVGDVLITKSRDLRVVRETNYAPSGHLRSVALAIRKCSWTGRAYTMYTRTDLRTIGMRKAGLRARMDGPLDAKLAQDLEFGNRFDQRLTCVDARSLA